jgi:hypothetical protein
MQVKESELRRMSVGIVAENKPLDSHLVDIIPIEALNLMDSELGTDTVNIKTSGIDVEEKPYKVEVDMGATLTAEWLGETNRTTSPDVRRGEQVWIWRQGDADKYYWTAMGRDDDLRRLETVIYRYSGLPENIDEEITEDNSYFLEVSTHQKTVTLKTSKRNDEFCIYTLQFNPGDGQVTLTDDLGNIIQIDSARTNIFIRNADNSFVELNRKHINIQSDTSINVASRDIRVRCKDFSLRTTGDCEFLASGWLQQVSQGKQLVESKTALILRGPRRTITL